MGTNSVQQSSIKSDILKIAGIGLTAAAFGFSVYTFIRVQQFPENQQMLYNSIMEGLKNVSIWFIISSFASIISYLLCHVRDLAYGKGRNEELITFGAVVLGVSVSIGTLLWGIIQMYLFVQMMWGKI